MNQLAPKMEDSSVYECMSRVLDLKLGSEADAFRLAEKGLSASAVKRVVGKLKFAETLVGSESTVRRRLKGNDRFSVAESERVLRFVRVYAEAVQLFGNEKAAQEWLNTPEDYLKDQRPMTPLALASSDAGARLIESHLLRTAHGIF